MKKYTGFFLLYTERCTPTVRRFKTKDDRAQFMAEFLLEAQDNDDNWVDGTVEGTITLANTGVEFKDYKGAA